jgi:hypothetical protein
LHSVKKAPKSRSRRVRCCFCFFPIFRRKLVKQFGTGLAALGDRYEDYGNLFGESVIINRNFFYYPAIKHTAVDFITNSYAYGDLTYKFLYGFGFHGSYNFLLSFDCKSGAVGLDALMTGLFGISNADVLGVVILAESSGLWGMNLKRVPVIEQKPADGKDIFDPDNFSEWIDFPVEPADFNHVIAGTGIVIKERRLVSPQVQSLISEGSTFHIHAGIFETQPLCNHLRDFEKELDRVLTGFQAYKVQHILGTSRFSSGMVGIIELQD